MKVSFSLYSLITGLAVFLLGMRLLTDGLKKMTGARLGSLLSRATTNRFSSLLVGTFATAAVQNSTAVTVMTVSFVDASLMTLSAAAAVIMGANIGTTLTGFLVALESLDIGLFLRLPVILGLVLVMGKNPDRRQIGWTVAGLGILFIGLELMNEGVVGLENNALFVALFSSVRSPVLVVVLGAVLSALLQSSTAINTLVIALCGTGMDIVSAVFIVLGTNVGTCLTALLASVDAGAEAKRASAIHLLFNAFGTILFGVVLAIIPRDLFISMMNSLFGPNPKFQLALFNFVQNLVCALIMLPFINQLIRLSELFILRRNGEKINKVSPRNR